ncbi:hypothetical protein JK628_21320 [Shewanella sp. KX20019]|uniref:hypothetical protein n=1 Tax=Shewanella sp. KX20019 TaxID=2803864 RepID=UPI0019266A2A|nr:hypothetical protein [Shewanella sp. KX20019]QQX79996.1 hypothetical protein JK628_21320 [Shewanella sp. KX20019]
MSKKLENRIAKNFDKVFNFEQFTSQDQLNIEPVGRDFLNQFVSEFSRLNRLSIPLTVHHIENINGIPTPTEYPTSFQKIKHQLAYIQFLYEELERLQNKLINFPQENKFQLDDIKALSQSHEKSEQAKFTLGLLVGAHNQEMNNSYFNEAGKAKMQAEQLKSINKYNQKYAKALELTQKVLSHFYSVESNHPFKPSLLIDYIEMLCNEHKIGYPKDRKSEIFKDFINICLKAITPHTNWSGSTKHDYKHIDRRSFNKTYKPYIKQLITK